MRLVFLPNLKRKSLDTLSHTFFSVIHACGRPYDVLMVFNAANSLTLFLPRLFGKRIAINTDGLEWKRGKWGAVASRYYKFSEWLSTRLGNRIVADSNGISNYYRQTYGVDSSFIAYGAYLNKSANADLLAPLGLKPGEYFLQITRFEPENNPLLTIRAFRRLSTDKKLVLVGGVPYESAYYRQMLEEADDDVLLPGYIYERDLLNELWCNCFAYVHGNEVGGTNPALLQTMASGCFTIAIDVPFSHDVLADGGIYFSPDPASLANVMQWTLDHPDLLQDYKERAVERIRQNYSWELVTDGYETLFRELISGAHPWPMPRRR
jgi:glycosyltransferase involved in cell wall biosynthesis